MNHPREGRFVDHLFLFIEPVSTSEFYPVVDQATD